MNVTASAWDGFADEDRRMAELAYREGIVSSHRLQLDEVCPAPNE